MNRFLIITIIFIGLLFYLFTIKTNENFQLVKITTPDNQLLKTIRMGQEINYEGDDLKKLFGTKDEIKFSIPVNYELYITKNDNIITYQNGLHTINKNGVTKIKIIKVKQFTYLIKDYIGNIVAVVPDINGIDWDDLYVNYGYDDYWIYYPNNYIRPYYYFNHPRYNPRRYPYTRKRTTTARSRLRDLRRIKDGRRIIR